ncbi:MAG: ABC transporter ATP-binding protein [Parvibaculaceae bacterium]
MPRITPRIPTLTSEAPASGASVPITIRTLNKTYGPYRALDALDLDIAGGEFLTLLGPSGSGKSTLLMAIAGFLRPDSGLIRFGGTDVTRLEPHKRNIGVVFQNYALFPHMSVAGNVAYPLKLRRMSKAEIARRVAWALALVKLEGFGERGIHQLSGGQRQRVALARAVVFEPSVLLMDEPLSALDKKLREHMQIEIRRLHETLRVTTIYVTHDQREALTMSDRIAVINHGRFAQIGAPQALYERPASKFVAEFIGDATLLPLDPGAKQPSFRGRPVKTRDKADGSASHVVLRPEKLRLVGTAEAAPWNRFAGTIDDIVYQGESVLLSVRLEGGETLFLRQATDQESLQKLPARHAAVEVGLHADDTLLVPEELGR